ncbi:Rad17-domain-containing protein [Sodiomyces alkalinus F11]|uniref:Rad17-domain-containing protein n=1 Tax=Sodiomyces alkalinus (strain CBS 110278 / VKM F-3762 / F11) TaxID=1314773 RepID=A0A3N2PZ18_SODAK|nr:Rad17-domain-containing protein [Sodiomyces alkalinus F11]ROT39744.1 Rad17-domain-containing protein [Sodiomyces alkalinus F11]
MAPPPAKRRKRNVVHDSDGDDENPPANTLTNFLLSSPSSKITSTSLHSRAPAASPSPSKEPTRLTRASQSTIRASSSRTLPNQVPRSPSTSPEKPKSRSKKRVKTEEKGKSADLLTLFANQTQKAPTQPKPPSKTTPVDDIISDPISDDDDIADKKASSSSLVGKNARRRLGDGVPHTGHGPAIALNSSQKFLKPPRPHQPTTTVDDDLRPWAERFAPINLEELAVHKKKVADVRRWLEDVMGGRMRQRLLLLKGAAGSGKTTAMRLLARDLGFELLEWRNPTVALVGNTGFQSASAQFQEFLGRGGHFGQLDTDLERPDASLGTSGRQPDQPSRRVILIEEFPNTFARSSSALTSFRNTILDYLATNTPALATFGRQPLDKPITPVVMIISETLLTTTSASADSFTAHRLLGPEILRHPGTGIIEFNPIAPSILAKALELVVIKEARKSGRRRTPGPLVLKRLGKIGDIRSAISSLEFLCLKGDHEADWGAKVAFTKPKKGARDGIALTKGEADSLELVSQREASLGVFHAVGKVVYNKRDERPPPDDTVEVLPSYMSQYVRPNRSQVSIDTLIDETGTDTHTFVSALHENYVLSCESQDPRDPSSSLDYINGCIEYLSQSDLLCPSWDIFFGGRGHPAGFVGKDSSSHVLRQDEMTFQVAVRGLLFSLPSPVKRKAPTGTKGSDAFKMFYPTSIKLWRSKEEMEGLVDLWSTKLLKGEESAARKDVTQGAAAFRRPKEMGTGSSSGSWVAAQQSKGSSSSSSSSSLAAAAAGGQQNPEAGGAVPLLSLGSAARREMLLERLPYMAQIARGRKGASLHALRLRDIEKVVSFRGIGPEDESGDEAAITEEEGGVLTAEAWATDRPSEESSPRKKAVAIRARSDGSTSRLGMQSLVISDDDIEDD